jgi:hypothetical protein
MKLKLTYFIEDPIKDTARHTELISENIYPDDSNNIFMEAFADAVSKAETIYNLCIDSGGDADWHELDFPDVVYEDEVKEMAPKAVAALKEIENALKEFEVKD